jgi:glucose/arabinose dehydrogenase
VALACLPAAPAAATTLPGGFGETTLATGLNQPTAVDWAPDGRMFIAEKQGVVRVRTPQGDLLTLLDIRDEVNSRSDRGLLGLAVDTDFETNGYLYLLYVHELNPLSPDSLDPMVSRLTRVTVKPDNTLENPTDPETVILGTEDDEPCPDPDNTRDCIPADFKWHVIGTVRSDPSDGTLWVGTGDTHDPLVVDGTSYRPLDNNTYAGKILHIDRNGHGLPNHPFCPQDADLTHVCTKIYAKGFRNPYRFTLRPGERGPAVGDVGQGHEELNLTRPGGNYGWPCYEGNVKYWVHDDQPRCLEEYAKEGAPDAAAPPSWTYPRPPAGSAIVAGPTYPGGNYPSDYNGKIFIGDYVQGWVKLLSVNSNDQVTGEEDFATGLPPAVDLELMPNGDLAYVDIGFGTGGSVRRFTYAGGNLPPTPVASATPTEGEAPLDVQFEGSGSTDPEDDSLTYDWDFGDGSPHSSEADPVHTYTDPGSYTARLTVDDGHDRNPNTTVHIEVGGNEPPTVEISEPVDGATYRAGDVVELAGSASDPEDGQLTGEDLEWRVLLRHGTHLHDEGTFTGEQAQFLTDDGHDADSHYEITLTATDSGGRSAEQRIEIQPETVDLTLFSSPIGAPITYPDAGTSPAPVEVTAAVGFKATIEAADTFVHGGRTYRFVSWSDGGARQHQITVPATDATLTADYRDTSPPPDGSPIPPPPGASDEPGEAGIVDHTVKAKKVLALRIACAAGRDCDGAVEVTTAKPVRVARAFAARKKVVKLAGASISIVAGHTETVRAKLTRKGRKLLRARRRVKATVTITTSGAGGDRATTERVTVRGKNHRR